MGANPSSQGGCSSCHDNDPGLQRAATMSPHVIPEGLEDDEVYSFQNVMGGTFLDLHPFLKGHLCGKSESKSRCQSWRAVKLDSTTRPHGDLDVEGDTPVWAFQNVETGLWMNTSKGIGRPVKVSEKRHGFRFLEGSTSDSYRLVSMKTPSMCVALNAGSSIQNNPVYMWRTQKTLIPLLSWHVRHLGNVEEIAPHLSPVNPILTPPDTPVTGSMADSLPPPYEERETVRARPSAPNQAGSASGPAHQDRWWQNRNEKDDDDSLFEEET